MMIDAYLEDRKNVVAAYATLEHTAKPLKEHFGEAQPQHITKHLVKQYWKKREKLGRKNGTVIKELGMLRAVLSFGKKNGWIDNPPHIERPRADPPMDRWLTHEEANKVLEACRSNHIKLFILLALKTGARMSAILDLTWDRVSLEKDIIFYPLPGKNHGKKRRAIVSISPDLKQELIMARKFAESKWVIEYNGKRLKNVRTAFKNTVKAAGVDHCRIHDLRHTCATWMIMAGVPVDKVAKMLGDRIEMIEKVYGHHSPEYLKEAANALDW
jgi:integrase